MENKIVEWLGELTLEEKASLCSGLDFWHTQKIERLGIPSLLMADGPHGLRKQTDKVDHLGISTSIPATCYPTAVGLASSWNRELINQVGEALGQEASNENISLLLGPGVNIKRSPLCGRNFEYFSEDPYLTSQLASSFIRGVQNMGVGACIKHFVANNQEFKRKTIDAIIDERTFREIYLASFEDAIKEAKPRSVMSSYNKVNGEYVSESSRILENILRNEWGFDGLVVSDWGGIDQRVDSLSAGLDLEMPSSGGAGTKKIIDAVQNGMLSEQTLNKAVVRILRFVLKSQSEGRTKYQVDLDNNHQFAIKVAEECVVLLKNEDQILPLQKSAKIALIGEFLEQPRIQGGGSSKINAYKKDMALEKITAIVNSKNLVSYTKGYSLKSEEIEPAEVAIAVENAKRADVAVLFLGLPEHYESEGFDRSHLSIPRPQIYLLEKIAEVQPNIVVVLTNGAPIEMPWVDKAKAILEGYLGGQGSGSAIANILFGDTCPSGRLAETFPIKLSDNPSFLNFPGEGDQVEYKEGIFVGYRYYQKKNMQTLFSFGHGLSYTTFEYSNMNVSNAEINEDQSLLVSITIKNTGKIAGSEVAQLYVSDLVSRLNRPIRELRGFNKIHLNPGESKEVKFVLTKRDFSFYDVTVKDWVVESGEFEIHIGGSSEKIELSEVIVVNALSLPKKIYHRNTLVGDLINDCRTEELGNRLAKLTGLEELLASEPEFLKAALQNTPLRGVINFSKGQYTEEMMELDIKKLNEM